MQTMIRLAKEEEIPWINQCYSEVEFVHSHFNKETIAIAEVNDQKAGLGRLVTLDDQHAELGGMYVFEPYRKKGIATEIVKFLLEKAFYFRIIYCLPFEHLALFYEQFGFEEVSSLDPVPDVMMRKWEWCNETYKVATSLLILQPGK